MSDYILVHGELYHYGIKGMKWGVRRFQNKDGTRTAVGKKRYNADSGSKKSKSSKSTHRLRLEDKYKSQGMSVRDAQVATEKRIRTEKAIAAAAGIAIAAAAVYATHKHVTTRVDKVLKAGTQLQVIGTNPNKNFDKQFYAAYKNVDKTTYRGLYGKHLNDKVKIFKPVWEAPGKVYNTTLEVGKDAKIASRKTASDVFADLYKNDHEFQAAFKRNVDNFTSLSEDDRKFFRNMTDKDLRKKGYDMFNIGLVDHGVDGTFLSKKFGERMKTLGYDGVIDINDQKYSGYRSKAPVIMFGGSNKLSISSVKELTEDIIRKDLNKTTGRIAYESMIDDGKMYLASVAGLAILGSSVDYINDAENSVSKKHK